MSTEITDFSKVREALKKNDFTVSRWCRVNGFSRSTVSKLINSTYPPTDSRKATEIITALRSLEATA